MGIDVVLNAVDANNAIFCGDSNVFKFGFAFTGNFGTFPKSCNVLCEVATFELGR